MMLEQRAIGTFASYEGAETALRELKESGFLMHQVSLIGRDVNRHAESTGVHNWPIGRTRSNSHSWC
jgi:hypothetical protein